MADKRGGSLRSRVRAEHWFCGHSEWPKKRCKKNQKVMYSDTRKCRKEFLKYKMGFSEKHRVIFSKRLVNTKVILGGA